MNYEGLQGKNLPLTNIGHLEKHFKALKLCVLCDYVVKIFCFLSYPLWL